MAIGAHDHIVRPAVGGIGEQGGADVLRGGQLLQGGGDAVAGEVAGDVEARQLLIGQVAPGDAHHLHLARPFENVDRARQGPGRGQAAIPADHGLAQLRRALVDIGHHEDRTARAEQRALHHQLVVRAPLVAALTGHGDVEMPREPPEVLPRLAGDGLDHHQLRLHRGGRGGGDFLVVLLGGLARLFDGLSHDVVGILAHEGRGRHDLEHDARRRQMGPHFGG